MILLFSLPNELRIDYCELWRALILRDTKKIELYGKKLGAGEYWNLLALVLTFRPVGKYVDNNYVYHINISFLVRM